MESKTRNGREQITQEKVNGMEAEAKINDLTERFMEFEPSTNRIIVTGSMDYMRIALRESDLDCENEFELLQLISRYLKIIEELSHEVESDEEFTYMDLDDLEKLFDQFQDFVSENHIIKRMNDDDFDESLCHY